MPDTRRSSKIRDSDDIGAFSFKKFVGFYAFFRRIRCPFPVTGGNPGYKPHLPDLVKYGITDIFIYISSNRAYRAWGKYRNYPNILLNLIRGLREVGNCVFYTDATPTGLELLRFLSFYGYRFVAMGGKKGKLKDLGIFHLLFLLW